MKTFPWVSCRLLQSETVRFIYQTNDCKIVSFDDDKKNENDMSLIGRMERKGSDDDL